MLPTTASVESLAAWAESVCDVAPITADALSDWAIDVASPRGALVGKGELYCKNHKNEEWGF